MDDSLTFVKTLAGERAMMERTRLVQRNLRMVLILVERHSNVADLKTKIGGSIIVESALTELEQMGLIERFDNPRREDSPKAVDESPQVPSTPPNPPAAKERVSAIDSPEIAPVEHAEDGPLTVDTVFETFADIAADFNGNRNELTLSSEPNQPQQPPKPDPKRPSLAARIRDWRALRAATREENQFDKVYREDLTEPITIKPLSQRGNNKRAARPSALALLGLIVVFPLLALVFPYGRYAPEIEAAVALALHSPVRIESIRLSIMPYPNLTLQGIAVGGGKPYAMIGEARLVPDPLSFWSASPVLQFLELAQVHVRSTGIDRTAQWLSGGNGDRSGWRVRRGRVTSLSIELGDKSVGELGGDLDFGADGTLTKVLLNSGTTRIEAVPNGKLFRLGLASDALTVPSHPPVQISDFASSGELTPQQLRLTEINAHFYDGRLDGKVTIDWSEGANFVGDFEIKRANIGKLLAAISPDSSFAGDASGTVHVEGRAHGIGGLADDVHVDASFVGQRIVIERFGLVDAVVSHSRETTRSGTTRLDNLGGILQCDRRECRINNLTMTSGVMHANGQVTILRASGKLDGSLQVELQRTAADINAPVSLQGSLALPEVRRR